MKVIFVASLSSPSASGRQRLWAMEQCNSQVAAINKEAYASKWGRWAGYIGKALQSPKMLCNSADLQEDIFSLAEEIKPDVIWFEWAKEIAPQFLKKLKRLRPRPVLISFQDDNPWGERIKDQWMWRQYFKLISEFDVHVVKRNADVDMLTSLGARKCYLWKHGIFSPLFYPAKKPVIKQYPISFVGTCMDGRDHLIGYLLNRGIPIHVFGNKWQQRSHLPKLFPDYFHAAVEGEDYANVIRKSHICLGLVSHSNKDEWTMRTFEVPGCSGLLLAERTPTHEMLFEEGKDASFFSTPEECANKIEDLLSDVDRCRIMGEAAYRKFMTRNWTLESSMKELMHLLASKQVQMV